MQRGIDTGAHIMCVPIGSPAKKDNISVCGHEVDICPENIPVVSVVGHNCHKE